ncbi:M20 metallopeptidase family protein [Lysinibacillus antri]|uniref:M20 metallopeptidase family protein n=1 Tax=Lysinibacillus antri TaxID=2498145 RepID=UPI001FE995FA|nr:amidohydrolase [Lysinibacillus antri]
MNEVLDLTSAIQKIIPIVVKWRRYFHEHPELSYEEFHTSDFIYDQLISFGNLEVTRLTKTSIVAKLIGSKPGKTIALRADMDALPIQEETTFSFASKTPDIMHACGHDGHIAILLGVAKIVSQLKDHIYGEIRFIFQHAEEVFPGGAKELVDLGVLEGVNQIFGIHLLSSIPTGKIGITTGSFTANSDTFEIEIIGKGGHSAEPNKSINPLLIGAQLINNLHHIISQKVDVDERAILAVTEFNGGSAKNIIPDRAFLGGGVRTFSSIVRKTIEREIEQHAKNITAVYGANYIFEYTYGYSSIINDTELSLEIEKVVSEYFGDDAILRNSPIMVGEDFSAYLTKVPGIFVGVGAAFEDETLNYPHHHPKFAINENALENGLKLFIYTISRWNMKC